MALFWIALVCFAWCIDVEAQNPVVTTIYGDVEGISVPIHTGDIIDSYMAVPYALAPVGDRRFTVSFNPFLVDVDFRSPVHVNLFPVKFLFDKVIS